MTIRESRWHFRTANCRIITPYSKLAGKRPSPVFSLASGLWTESIKKKCGEEESCLSVWPKRSGIFCSYTVCSSPALPSSTCAADAIHACFRVPKERQVLRLGRISGAGLQCRSPRVCPDIILCPDFVQYMPSFRPISVQFSSRLLYQYCHWHERAFS